MMRLSAVVLGRDERAVLAGLGRMGVMHLTRTPAGPETAPLAPPDRSEFLTRCDQIQARIRELRRLLHLPPEPSAADFEWAASLSLDGIEERLAKIEQDVAALDRRREDGEARRSKLAAVIEQVTSFRGLDLPFGELGQSPFLHFAIGSLPEEQVEGLRGRVADNVLLLPLPRGSGRCALVAVTSRTGRFAMETALQQSKFQRETPPLEEGVTADALVEEGEREQQRIAEELRRTDLAGLTLAAAAAPQLDEMELFVFTEHRMLEAEQNFPRTEATVLIAGWVPAAEVPAVTQRLKELTRGSGVVETTAPESLPDEEVPVLLRHPRMLRPFEMLVAAYGLPGYRDLEPTLFVAITYLLMFGMMFGDVGHGAVLALGGAAALVAGRARKVRDVGVLLGAAGLASMAFGVLYGSYFGIAGLRRYALWHDPLEGSPLDLMKAAVGLGVVVVSLGMVLNMVNRFRKRDWLGGFLDSFGVVGALFYWGVLGLLLKFAALKERGLVGLVVALAVALPLVAWALREPLRHALDRRAKRHSESSGFLEATMESVVEAFEAVLSYMANTISFVRLAAYAMSHAAVLMATFVMAAEVKKTSGGGDALSVLVIIAGNVVAILLEGVIAAVQALRLEYYEFFGKFFSGSGRAFTPFRLDGKREP
jgi:V/A-type H+-transporting ATPase subunit I